MIGSLATAKRIPKDADVLVTIADLNDLAPLARLGRRLKGAARHINLGADIFLADTEARYLGRVCGYRECYHRALCRALHCTRVPHLDDDLQIVTLSRELLLSPPLELWPDVVRRCQAPADVEQLLLTQLERPTGN